MRPRTRSQDPRRGGTEADDRRPTARPYADLADIELLAHVRDGEAEAFAPLWERHSAAARRVAARISSTMDPDDLLHESYARVLAAVRAGHGPHTAFVPYLYATMRNVSQNAARHVEEPLALDLDVTDLVGPTEDDLLDRAVLRKAFADLRPQWRDVLWLTEIEGLAPRDVAARLGVSSNAAAAQAYRARDALRAAWLAAHVPGPYPTDDCAWCVARLVRERALTRRGRRRLDAHLTGCDHCRAVERELVGLRGRLRGLLLPLAWWPGGGTLPWLPPEAGGGGPLLDALGRAQPPLPAAPGAGAGVAGSAMAGATAVALSGAAAVSFGAVAAVPDDAPAIVVSAADDAAGGPALDLPVADDGDAELGDDTGGAAPGPADTTVAAAPSAAASTLETAEDEAAPAVVPDPAPSASSPAATPSPTVLPGAATPPPGAEPEPEPEPELTVAPVGGDGRWLPELAGTGRAGSPFTVLVDGVAAATGTVDGSGAWDAVVDAAPGAHHLTVRSGDDEVAAGAVDLTAPRLLTVQREGTAAPRIVVRTAGRTPFALVVDGTRTEVVVPASSTVRRTLRGLDPGEHVVTLRHLDPGSGRRGAARSRTVLVGDAARPGGPATTPPAPAPEPSPRGRQDEARPEPGRPATAPSPPGRPAATPPVDLPAVSRPAQHPHR